MTTLSSQTISKHLPNIIALIQSCARSLSSIVDAHCQSNASFFITAALYQYYLVWIKLTLYLCYA